MGNFHTIGNERIRLVVDMSEGMNVNSISFDDKNIIICDEKRRESGSTYGIPVLFPTPNRTENNKYRYDKKDIPTVMHGFLRHKGFKLDEISGNKVRGHYNFTGSNELFPYRSTMNIEINVTGNSVFWFFNFVNRTRNNMAYNLALHPFFTKDELDGIEVGVEEEMLNDDRLIPTGETVIRDRINLRTEDISMDTVFMMDTPFEAKLHYRTFDVSFKASEDFKHAVVYSNPEKEFVCIEPQTGSTDAHNLHEKGFEREAALIEVRAKQNHLSWFCLEFDK